MAEELAGKARKVLKGGAAKVLRVDDAVREYKHLGFNVEQTGGTHFKVRYRDQFVCGFSYAQKQKSPTIAKGTFNQMITDTARYLDLEEDVIKAYFLGQGKVAKAFEKDLEEYSRKFLEKEKRG